MSCGIGHTHSLDPVLLWLWCRPAATARIQPLAWEIPYAVGTALKRKKKKKKNTNSHKYLQINNNKTDSEWQYKRRRLRNPNYYV